MTLRIFQLSFGSDESNMSLNYYDVQCDSWEVVGNMLLVRKQGKAIYISLLHVKSFYEVG